MINTNISFRIFSGVMLASVALMAVGCMKPSVRDLADDLHSSGGSSLTIWHDSFEAAREQALVSGKPILADFTGSDWCSWCVKLKKDVFNKPEFEAWARENVVLLELDYPQRSRQSSEIQAQNEKLASLYSIDSYPTVLLLDAQGNQLARTGYHPDPAAFIGTIESQLQ
ncbi:thioredoxin family protein [Mariniblastus sp.]|nr:thioredoxin family protein [Mariniblastus sp.]